MADGRATERIVEACDWKSIHMKEKNRIDSAMRRLNKSDRAFARAVLREKSWQEMGIPRSTFSDRLKKLKKSFCAHKLRVKYILTNGLNTDFFGHTPILPTVYEGACDSCEP